MPRWLICRRSCAGADVGRCDIARVCAGRRRKPASPACHPPTPLLGQPDDCAGGEVPGDSVADRLVRRAAGGSRVRARHPPLRPCIAEYGADFPAFLAVSHTDNLPPYVRSFAELEWAVAQASIAVSEPPATWSDVVAVGTEALPDTAWRLQSGLRFVHVKHAVDTLMTVYLGGTEPNQFTLADEDVWIQVLGSRGDISLARLDAPTFTFRAALFGGQALGHAVEQALGCDAGFDTAFSLRMLIAEGLVAFPGPCTRGDASREIWVTVREWLERMPLSLVQLAMRIGVGSVFFKAGLLRIQLMAVYREAVRGRIPGAASGSCGGGAHRDDPGTHHPDPALSRAGDPCRYGTALGYDRRDPGLRVSECVD